MTYFKTRMAEIRAEIIARPTPRIAPYSEKVRTQKAGYVYFVKAGNEVKIGFSTNPRERLHSIQTGCARPVKMVKILRGSPALEKSLHRRFSDFHLHGEWFDLRGKLAKYLERYIDPVAFPDPVEYHQSGKKEVQIEL